MPDQENIIATIPERKRWTITIYHPRFVMLMIGFCMIILFRVGLSIQMPIWIYIAYAVLLSALTNKEEQIAFLCSQIAFTSFLQYRYVLLVSILFLILKKGRSKYNNKNLVPFLLIVIWELLHASVSHLEIYGFLQEISELLTLTCILIDEPMDYSDALPIRTLAYSAVFAMIMDVVASVKIYGFSFQSLGRLGDASVNTSVQVGDFQGIINPNEAGLMCMLAIGGLLLIRQLEKDKNSDAVLIIILCIFTLLTQSRSAILGIILLFLLYPILSGNVSHIAAYRFVYSFIGIAIGVVVIFVFFRNYIDAFLSRFNTADVSHGRLAIFAFYTMHLFKEPRNWLFGIGLYNYNITLTKLYGGLWTSYPGLARYIDKNYNVAYKVSHNSVQEIIVAWGVLGIVLVCLLLYKMVKHKSMKTSKANNVLLLVLLLISQLGQLISSGIMMLGLIFCLVAMEYSPYSSENS